MKFIKTSLLMRVIVVMLIAFGAKLFISCKPNPPIEIHYNTINIIGVDNSGRFMNSNVNVDTMYSGAVALKLTLSDSTNDYYALSFNKIINTFSFPGAMALSLDESFIPVNKVVQIKIFTMFDINENIKAGEDITNFIVYETGYDFELYKNMNNAIETLNRTQSNSSGSIVMVLKETIDNTNAQFRVQIVLDNNNELSFITNTYSIITQ